MLAAVRTVEDIERSRGACATGRLRDGAGAEGGTAWCGLGSRFGVRRGGGFVWMLALAVGVVLAAGAPAAHAAAGTISTIAGDGTPGSSGDGGSATSAELSNDAGVAFDPSGDLLVSEYENSRVRLVAAATCSSGCPYGLSSMTKGDIYTVAGTGTAGIAGAGMAATSAELAGPRGIAVDSRGDLLIADAARALVVAWSSCTSGCPYGLSSMTRGYMYTIAGTGTAGPSGDGGPATSAKLNTPGGLSVDPSGDLVVVDTENARVRLVASSPCASGCPYGLSSMAKGDIYTIAGTGTGGYSGDAGPATSAKLSNPYGIDVDPSGDLLIADTSNGLVRLVAGSSCASGCPYGLSSMTRGDIYTIAGTGTGGYSGDAGPATSAELRLPEGVAVDPGGDLLIGDSNNNRVRLVAAASCSSGCPYGLASMTKGDIYTIAGNGTSGYLGNGGQATVAELDAPDELAFDAVGDLAIADSSNEAVRLVTTSPWTPSILTVQRPASATVGSAIADQASVSGGDGPTGTVTFDLYNNPNGTGTPLFADTEPLSGGVATSRGFTTSAAATDYWVATYSGDAGNNSVASGTATEPVTIIGPPTAAVTTPAAGATYAEGATVDAAYACSEDPSGPGLKSGSGGCSGPVADGAAIGTSTPGQHTFTVTATSSDGLTTGKSVGYSVSAPPPVPPTVAVDNLRPAIAGSPRAGATLTCDPGTWVPTPTGYGYAWASDGTPIQAASGATYVVAPIDEGQALTCTVTAYDAAGAGAAVVSAPIQVAVPKVAGCPAATGLLSATSIGQLRLGMTRAQARHADSQSSTRGRASVDFFCFTPQGVRVGYPSALLLRSLTHGARARYAGHVIWISTGSARYAVNGIRHGATLQVAAAKLRLSPVFVVGLNDWYLAPYGGSTAVLKVSDGLVQEIGIATRALTTGSRVAQRTFLTSFN